MLRTTKQHKEIVYLPTYCKKIYTYGPISAAMLINAGNSLRNDVYIHDVAHKLLVAQRPHSKVVGMGHTPQRDVKLAMCEHMRSSHDANPRWQRLALRFVDRHRKTQHDRELFPRPNEWHIRTCDLNRNPWDVNLP